MTDEFQNFTQKARQAMAYADEEARKLNHEYIGTEHILLGLLKDEYSFAVIALKEVGVDLEKIRAEILKLGQQRPDKIELGKLPKTPNTRMVMRYAQESARNLNHNYIGTEHLLLGMLRVHEGRGAEALTNAGLSLSQIYEGVMDFISSTRCNEDELQASTDNAAKFASESALKGLQQNFLLALADGKTGGFWAPSDMVSIPVSADGPYKGRTLLSAAIEHKNIEAIIFLRAKGARVLSEDIESCKKHMPENDVLLMHLQAAVGLEGAVEAEDALAVLNRQYTPTVERIILAHRLQGIGRASHG